VEPPKSTVEQKPVNCDVVISDGAKSQTIYSAKGYYEKGQFGGVGNDADIKVIRCGDLNRDGRLDLLIDLTDHYNVSRPTLFISSGTKSNILLIEVAEHYSVGC
jgi:hypothetical protein